jgi:hypothetical protein
MQPFYVGQKPQPTHNGMTLCRQTPRVSADDFPSFGPDDSSVMMDPHLYPPCIVDISLYMSKMDVITILCWSEALTTV